MGRVDETLSALSRGDILSERPPVVMASRVSVMRRKPFGAGSGDDDDDAVFGGRAPSCGGEGAFYGFGGAIDDGEQHAAWPFGGPSVLLPIFQGGERD